MANEIKIKVTSEADTKGLKDADKALADVKVSAYVAGQEVNDLGKEFTESDRKAKEAVNGYTSIKDSLLKLDIQAEISRTELRKLSAALADTDDAAQRIDISKAIRKLNADLAATTAASKRLKILADVDVDKAGFAKKISDLGSGITGLASNQAGLIIGASIGAAVGPTLLSAAGAAIAGGVGLGVLGLGIVKAVQADDNLTLAGQKVVEKLNRAITANVSSLTVPIENSFEKIGAFAERLQGKIGPVFRSLADDVGPFIDKVLGAGEAISDVLLKKATESGPAIDALGDGISMLGSATAGFLDKIVDTGPGAADNLRLVLGGISDLITFTGNFLGLIQKLSENEWLTGPLLPLLRKHYADAGDSTKDLAGDTEVLAEQMDDAGKAALGQQEALAALSNEMKKQSDPVFNLMDAMHKLDVAQQDYEQDLKKFGPTNETTEKALRKLGAAGVDVEAAVGALGAGFDGKLTPAMRNTLSAAGLTRGQINALEGQFKDAKRAGDAFSKKYTASAQVNGISSAQGKIRSITDDLRDFQGKWTATMIVNYQTFGKPGSGGGLATGGISGAANGQTSSNLTWVGENGPELANLPSGTRVWSHGDSMRMASQSGGGGGGEFILRAAPGASRDLMSVIIEGLRYEVDRNGQGSVQRLLGSPGVA